jgi:hypothetical protein
MIFRVGGTYRQQGSGRRMYTTAMTSSMAVHALGLKPATIIFPQPFGKSLNHAFYAQSDSPTPDLPSNCVQMCLMLPVDT